MTVTTKGVSAFLKRRPLICACALLALAMSVAIYLRWSIPSELQAGLEEREKDLKRIGNNVKFASQLDAHLEVLRIANAKIGDAALRPAELARNQQIFYRLETDTGLKLVDLGPQASPIPVKGAPGGTTYLPISFSLTLRGRYEQILDFLNRLDHLPTLSRVTTAGFSPPDDSGNHTVGCTVELLGLRQ